MNKAVFLDRDGVICEDVNYLDNVGDLSILPGVPEAVRMLHEHGFKVIIVTNQSGIARGFFSLDTLNHIHEVMIGRLRDAGAIIDNIFYCPHHPDDHCTCRKPNSGLFFQAKEAFDIDLTKSFMVGDRWSDMEAGKRIGCKTVYIRINPDDKMYNTPESDHVAQNLLEAVEWITR